MTNPNWLLEGLAFWASLATGTDLYPVHRFRNKTNGSYLYSIYESERAEIAINYAATFVYEGVAWYARQTPATGWSALYRFRNKTNGTYLFSAYESEKNAIVATYPDVFALEGIAYYVRQEADCSADPIGSTGYSLVFKGCIAANVAEYYDKTECVRDNATGLIWQGQTPAGSGLRANDAKKTNFDSTVESQKFITSGLYRAPTQAEIDGISNSIGYKNAVNFSSLCGYWNWRLPTYDELNGLVKRGEAPSINNAWFPNTSDLYWTTSRSPYIEVYSRVLNFMGGYESNIVRNGTSIENGGSIVGVRLVR